jgi:hypothetical protein
MCSVTISAARHPASPHMVAGTVALSRGWVAHVCHRKLAVPEGDLPANLGINQDIRNSSVYARRLVAVTFRLAGRLIKLAATLAALLWMPMLADAQTPVYQVDDYGSHRVTHFLHNHNLPLVGAQILDNNDGTRELHLFGFVATPYGMQDAQQKALKYLGDKTIKVVNSIEVNPSLGSVPPSASSAAGNPSLGMSAPPQSNLSAAPAAPVPPPAANSASQWDKAMQNIYKNGAQPLPQPNGP